MRVIVTGSRAWPDPVKVAHELTQLFQEVGPFQLVHGACSTGADAAAGHWYEVAGADLGCAEQRYPAVWARGPQAGPDRNRLMVEAGADLVLAFPLPEGSGTQHTMRLAREAGIEVREFRTDATH